MLYNCILEAASPTPSLQYIFIHTTILHLGTISEIMLGYHEIDRNSMCTRKYCHQAAAVARFASALQKNIPTGDGKALADTADTNAPILEIRFSKFRHRVGHTCTIVQVGVLDPACVTTGYAFLIEVSTVCYSDHH